MSNIDDDNGLLDRMIQTWYQSADDRLCKQYKIAMRRVLAVVREHDRPQPASALPQRRLPVSMLIDEARKSGEVTIIANDGTLHRGWRVDGVFQWRELLPPLPQPGEG